VTRLTSNSVRGLPDQLPIAATSGGSLTMSLGCRICRPPEPERASPIGYGDGRSCRPRLKTTLSSLLPASDAGPGWLYLGDCEEKHHSPVRA
jgi:hypothetical protein